MYLHALHVAVRLRRTSGGYPNKICQPFPIFQVVLLSSTAVEQNGEKEIGQQ